MVFQTESCTFARRPPPISEQQGIMPCEIERRAQFLVCLEVSLFDADPRLLIRFSVSDHGCLQGRHRMVWP